MKAFVASDEERREQHRTRRSKEQSEERHQRLNKGRTLCRTLLRSHEPMSHHCLRDMLQSNWMHGGDAMETQQDRLRVFMDRFSECIYDIQCFRGNIVYDMIGQQYRFYPYTTDGLVLALTECPTSMYYVYLCGDTNEKGMEGYLLEHVSILSTTHPKVEEYEAYLYEISQTLVTRGAAMADPTPPGPVWIASRDLFANHVHSAIRRTSRPVAVPVHGIVAGIPVAVLQTAPRGYEPHDAPGTPGDDASPSPRLM